MQQLNATTQPAQTFRVFNRADVLPRAWYLACRSGELPPGGVLGVQIGRQRLALFRAADGAVGALDAFCPHMGTDLALGAVVEGTLRCTFHHWRFTRDGRCARIPCQDHVPAAARTRAYAVTERYGAVWVWPDSTPDVPLLEVPGLEGREVLVSFDAVNESNAPYHVSMVNGLDMQHLATVHDLSIRMEVDIDEHDGLLDAVVHGPVPTDSVLGRLVRALVGPRYAYAMRYGQATVAALVLLRDSHFLRPSWRWPRLTMIFAYRPLPDGRSRTYPLFVAERTPGPWGWLRAQALLLATRVAYRFLEAEDERIYDHIRFSARNLLEADAPVARYIRYVEGLVPSDWSSPR
ncbi:MAG: hypothetical protein RLZZ299_602 [Pseudomonadota bacterium]|jgi:phenylpropionate dioxygenase-like ring-hydroxylating dioxygenase large terminal subunit